MATLQALLSGSFSLALSPGFFRFYGLCGVLVAFEENENDLLSNIKFISGASAGALVGGFLAAGLKPTEMTRRVLAIKREDFFDIGGFGGLLKGNLFQSILEEHLEPTKLFQALICRW